MERRSSVLNLVPISMPMAFATTRTIAWGRMTHWGLATETVRLMKTRTACVTTSTIVSANTTNAESAMAVASFKAPATVTATWSMRSAFVAELCSRRQWQWHLRHGGIWSVHLLWGTVWNPLTLTCEGSSSCPTDLDGDGATAVGDLLVMLGAFGQSCE